VIDDVQGSGYSSEQGFSSYEACMLRGGAGVEQESKLQNAIVKK